MEAFVGVPSLYTDDRQNLLEGDTNPPNSALKLTLEYLAVIVSNEHVMM